MAKESSLSNISKTELAEQYAKMKNRQQKAAQTAKAEGEALIRDAITVGTGFGVGFVMGRKRQEGLEAAGLDATQEDIEKEIAKAQQIGGIDMDLAIGGGLAAMGLAKLGGKMSDTVRAAGIGALTSWASRTGHEKGMDGARESVEEQVALAAYSEEEDE